MRWVKPTALACLALTLCACATTKGGVTQPSPEAPVESTVPETLETPITQAPIERAETKDIPSDISDVDMQSAEPEISPETSPEIESEPSVEPTEVEQTPAIDAVTPTSIPAEFTNLGYWAEADVVPALKAFQKTCDIWAFRKDEAWLHAIHKEYGQYKDWRAACQAALLTNTEAQDAKAFFQNYFLPLNIGPKKGLLTAYYAPEIEVRKIADAEFYEPILTRPTEPNMQSLPRKDLSVLSSKVLAFGRPIEVYFLQVQGSGRVRYQDGSQYVVAYNGNNGHDYKSIGRVLIDRGEMTRSEASKLAIEKWMHEAGYLASRELMNQNPRYIFFKTEALKEGVGPKGAMGLPLTAMGSLAIDPSAHPYGALIWLDVNLPKTGEDVGGQHTGLLLAAQDTGSAIKGKRRGDIYFGAGAAAGDRAGIMKHKGMWTFLLPTKLAVSVRAAREVS